MPNHAILQDSFLKYLQNEYGKQNVKRECRAWGFNKIDIVRKINDEFIFYEVKTYKQLLTSLRVAIGQLFEYCFYPSENNATELVLVSDIEPNKDFITYLKHLNSLIKIKLSYIQFDVKRKKIVNKI